jgi:hypothetical protein
MFLKIVKIFCEKMFKTMNFHQYLQLYFKIFLSSLERCVQAY